MNQKILSVGLLVNLTIAGIPIPAAAGVWLRSGNPNGTPIAKGEDEFEANPNLFFEANPNPPMNSSLVDSFSASAGSNATDKPSRQRVAGER